MSGDVIGVRPLDEYWRAVYLHVVSTSTTRPSRVLCTIET
jgi:hypothetical protein